MDAYEYECVLVDECDSYMLSDRWRNFLMFNINPKFLYGLSATYELNRFDSNVFNIVFGTNIVEVNTLAHIPKNGLS